MKVNLSYRIASRVVSHYPYATVGGLSGRPPAPAAPTPPPSGAKPRALLKSSDNKAEWPYIGASRYLNYALCIMHCALKKHHTCYLLPVTCYLKKSPGVSWVEPVPGYLVSVGGVRLSLDDTRWISGIRGRMKTIVTTPVSRSSVSM